MAEAALLGELEQPADAARRDEGLRAWSRLGLGVGVGLGLGLGLGVGLGVGVGLVVRVRVRLEGLRAELDAEAEELGQRELHHIEQRERDHLG